MRKMTTRQWCWGGKWWWWGEKNKDQDEDKDEDDKDEDEDGIERGAIDIIHKTKRTFASLTREEWMFLSPNMRGISTFGREERLLCYHLMC